MSVEYDPDFEVYLDLGRYVDLDQEIARLEKERARSQKESASLQSTLQNPKFLAKAPQEKVDEKKQRLVELETKQKKLGETLDEFRIS